MAGYSVVIHISNTQDQWVGPSGFTRAVFSFLYFLKIKISKIYVRFEIFQKYPPVAPIGRQALSVNFFFKFAMRSLKKKCPVAPQRATGPCRPWGGRQAPVARGG